MFDDIVDKLYLEKQAINMDELRALSFLSKAKKLNLNKMVPESSYIYGRLFSWNPNKIEDIEGVPESLARVIKQKGGLINKAFKPPWNQIKNESDYLDKINMEALNRIGDHHEYLETLVKPRTYTDVDGSYKKMPLGFSGHASPEVILKERNLIESLPEELNTVKHITRRLRETDKIPILSPSENNGNFWLSEYGFINDMLGRNILESGKPRLSRHAIKRISDIYDLKGYKKINKDIVDKYIPGFF